ncbi:MAG: hypothetical protein COV52_06215 [Gammaproteobacteria bacterium CG11_big_fil_rev_8_21_14_0_20_46_22]|nr:MAG: hypothetical protein COW05_07445 [Gammaproteobacteria bacterium CG12_big_fil_rev_8_21_14_0_65_46_12]PIR11097.1 MAG: hypothetical protein COV52_06215 [Gammaproteobacteria bacterium CG11_big_fil_rev_8_21_14_0_20_46_22]
MKRYYFITLTLIIQTALANNPNTFKIEKSNFYIVYNKSLVDKYHLRGVITSDALPKKFFGLYKMTFPSDHECCLGLFVLHDYFKPGFHKIALNIKGSNGATKSYLPRYSAYKSRDARLNYLNFIIPCETTFKKNEKVSLFYKAHSKEHITEIPISVIRRIWSKKSDSPVPQGGNAQYFSDLLNGDF